MDAASISQEPVPVSIEPTSEKPFPQPPEPMLTVMRPIPFPGNTVDIIESASFSIKSAAVSTEPVSAQPIYDSMDPVPVLVNPLSVTLQAPPAEDKEEKSRTMISREVQVECPHLLMWKKYDDQLMEKICVAPRDLESLDLSSQPLEEEPPGPCDPEHKLKSFNTDFLTDAKAGSTLFSFPMTGCKCTSCLPFFYDHSRNGRSKTNKDFKALQQLQSQKVQVNVQDYVIMSGNQSGTVHYVGHLDNSGTAGAVFLGLELDEPSGMHNGVFKGKRYYQCFKDCGLFVPIHKVYYRIRNKQKKTAPSPPVSAPPGLTLSSGSQHR
ncbi:hypothetical protein AAFF_G00002970 [Aldrovandia affinis]|uniref:CAP-Gly domain-containing protein n=1 Tax=Aldrovandia affinis TaxID=143900 RepID=A0AAD7X3L4_9TELE|nr:hypothetical protein AAFF_G00002970 [Aldrovandia affinis]